MKRITFNQFAIGVCLLCALAIFIAFKSAAQDTIRVKKVPVVNVLVDRWGNIKKMWYRNIKVKSGYIIKQDNGFYLVNNHEMKLATETPEFSYSKSKTIK